MLTDKEFDVKASTSHGKVFACRMCVDHSDLLDACNNSEEHVMWDLCSDCAMDEPKIHEAKMNNFIFVYGTLEEYYGFIPLERILFLLQQEDDIYWEPKEVINMMFIKGYVKHLNFNGVRQLSFTNKGIRHHDILCADTTPVLEGQLSLVV